jgi:hypothetical protein
MGIHSHRHVFDIKVYLIAIISIEFNSKLSWLGGVFTKNTPPKYDISVYNYIGFL